MRESFLPFKIDKLGRQSCGQPWQCTVGQSPKGMMVFIYIGHLSGLQGVEMCAGLLQSVPMGAAECVQGYRVCAGCSFNILPCSSRLNQKIFYWKKKYFIWMCIKNKNYMENWLFWGLNLGNLKQCMMIMLVLTSSSSAWTLLSASHLLIDKYL